MTLQERDEPLKVEPLLRSKRGTIGPNTELAKKPPEYYVVLLSTR